MTLRRLWGMVAAKREYDGGLAVLGACLVVAHIPLTGKALDPDAVNPYRQRSPEAAEQLAAAKRHAAWASIAVQAAEAFEKAGVKVEG